MFKKLCIFKKLIPIIILLLLTSCATTKKQPIVKPETIEKPKITENLENSLSDLTTQITNSITEDGKKKIAVIEFSDLDGNVTQFGKYLAEELITRLFRMKKFEVVERQLLNKILSEQKLGMTGLIDDESAIAIGKILGVDAIVSGTITDLGISLKVNARIISTETGKVFGVAGTNIVKDDNVRKLMGIISTVQKEEVQKQTEKKEISKEALKKVEAEKFTFELTKCEMSSGGNITCDFLITNNDKKDRELQLTTQHSRIFDNFGNEYHAKEFQLANKEGSYPKILLVSGVPTRAILDFEKVSIDTRSIALLELRCTVMTSSSGGTSFTVRLRNIPLSIGIISTVQNEEVQKQMEKKEISKEVLKKVEVENFAFELTKCEMSLGGRVTCDLLITNNDKKDREFKLYADRSRIFDDFGNEYRTKEAHLANKQGIYPTSLLVSGVPTKVILSFENVLLKSNNISLLEIYFDEGPWPVGPAGYRIRTSPFPKASIRNIPLSK